MRVFLVVGLLLGGLLPAQAETQSRTAPPLLLEVWVDGQTEHNIAPVTLEAGKIIMRADDLRRQGVKFTGQGQTIDLGQVAGLTAQIDQPGQRLMLTVAAEKLAAQQFDLKAPHKEEDAPEQAATGAILHYDLSSTIDDAARWRHSLSGGAAGTIDIFMPYGLFTTGGFANVAGRQFMGARLDTAFEFDRSEDMSRLIVGDAISGGPNWARSVRFGGIEYASDFSLRPDLVTVPLPAFFGQSQVPATVDVFSGAAHVFEQNVQPGPFELRNLPVVTGGGGVMIVTHDVLGRQTSQTLSLYTHPDQLAPGLSSYVLDAGFLRTGYGIDSFGYDAPIASASYRRGFDLMTLEAHGEAAPNLALLGGGVATSLGNLGMLALDLAGSSGKAGSGYLLSAVGEVRQGPLNFNFSAVLASDAFRDLGSLDGAPPARARYQAGFSANLDSMGILGVGWLRSDFRGGQGNNYLTASYSLPMRGSSYLAATALRDMHTGSLDLQISFTMPLDNGAMASVTGESDKGSFLGSAMYDKPANMDGGVGYRFLGRWDHDAQLQGDANWIGENVGASGAVSVQGGRLAMRGNADGALVMMRGSVFATHETGNAVALVETGAPGIQVYRENRPLGKSNAQGEMLLTGLDAYAANHVAIDPRDYAFDVVVDKPEHVVRPRRRSGVVVEMAPAVRHSVVAVVTRGVDMPIPLGAKVFLAGLATPLMVGHNGQVFIPDIQHPTDASVELDGGRCRIHIDPMDKAGAFLPRTGPLLCLREASNAY